MPGERGAPRALAPYIAVAFGIGLFAVMDGFMKSLTLAIGAYSAVFFRTLAGSLIGLSAFAVRPPKWPSAAILKLHIWRGFIVAVSIITFFYGIARVPIAEGLALSFISPIIALYLAAVLLREKISATAIVASFIGLAGVCIILLGRLGAETTAETPFGIGAILVSAVFYAYNLILQRQQALLAAPLDIAVFQNLVIVLMLALGAPWLVERPSQTLIFPIVISAALAFAAQMFLSWGYARAETQRLVPIEYSGFIWASVVGYIAFQEIVTAATIAGAILIMIGCWVATRVPARNRRAIAKMPPEESA